jgi:hypothetical protein
MKTSYRDIHTNQVEVSVTADDGKVTVIGILICDTYGKWNCMHNYFPIRGDLKHTVENKNSMVECGRSLVDAWEKHVAQKRFDEKLKEIRKKEREAEEKRERQREEEEQEYWNSLWNMDTYDPFEGEP